MRVLPLLVCLVAVAHADAPPKPCSAPEARQLDFWIGDWDLVVKTRKAPGSPEWEQHKAHNRVERTFGGCVIEEHFEAPTATPAWSGHSVSVWAAQEKRWRQTWVDDQGSFLAFTGGWQDGKMILLGEPRQAGGKTVQMRMVFKDIGKDKLSWSWERTIDGGRTWNAAMTIDYQRAAR